MNLLELDTRDERYSIVYDGQPVSEDLDKDTAELLAEELNRDDNSDLHKVVPYNPDNTRIKLQEELGTGWL